MDNININEIVKIEQMPKVFSQLEKIGEFIDEQTKDLDKLKCTEENKQLVKNRRTEINNTMKALEERRKEVKNKLLEPYEIFEEKYNKECKEKLEKASNTLKEKIDNIENEQKVEKELELREFVEQHCEANKVHIDFNAIGLNITLSASMKSLKEQAKTFIERIASDLKLIELEEYKNEILFEYNKNGCDFTKAKLDVITRHKQLEEIEKQQEEKEKVEQEEQKIIEKVEEITTPKEIIEDEDIIEVSFKVKGTKEQILKIKDLIIEMGLEYE